MSVNKSAYLGILNLKVVSSVNCNCFDPSKSNLNFCIPKLRYFAYVALKNDFLGFPFNIILDSPEASIFNVPPGIIYNYNNINYIFNY